MGARPSPPAGCRSCPVQGPWDRLSLEFASWGKKEVEGWAVAALPAHLVVLPLHLMSCKAKSQSLLGWKPGLGAPFSGALGLQQLGVLQQLRGARGGRS